MYPYEENPYAAEMAVTRPDYDVSRDAVIERRIIADRRRSAITWTLERPLYDVRFDAYWLVTKDEATYWFAGPLAISGELIKKLPDMSSEERKHALRHMPGQPLTDVNIHNVPIRSQPEEDDGA